MIFTPVRWVVMVGIAVCGYLLITEPSMYIRAGAFVGSLVCWQIHGILMVADGYALMQIKKTQTARQNAEPSLDELLALLRKHCDFTDAELETLLKSKRGVEYVENDKVADGQLKPVSVASSVQ